MKIQVQILSYGQSKHLSDCLKSLKKIGNYKNIQIVVIENAGEKNPLIIEYPEIKFMVNDVNLGFAEGNNVGFRYGIKNNVDYFLLLNDDTLVTKDFLINLLKFCKTHKKCGIVSPKIYFAANYEYKKAYKQAERGKVIWYAGGKIDWKNIYASHRGVDELDQGQYDKAEQIDFATGCCMLIKREVVAQTGGFDKNYFLYWEDIDLCERAKHKGWQIWYYPGSLIWHKNAGSSGGAGGKVSYYYQERNRLFFGFKHAAFKVKLHLLRQALSLLKSGDAVKKQAALDFLTSRQGRSTHEPS